MRKIAFLVGNDTFPKDPSIPPLRFTQNDARELAAVLEDRETCGFETKLYLNRPSQEVLTDLDQISGELGQDDTLLFYYSGHGKLRGNELCLVSNETTTTSLGATSIRTRLVLEYLQGSLARRRILILDCCHSGAIGRVYKAVDSKSTLDGLADSFGSYILTASTSIELAEEREKDGHGVFTKTLIDCLREGPKERITINDMYEYAHSRLKISARQTPLFWALQQEGTSVEIGNYQARHERERQRKREQLETERQLERERLERERQREQEQLIATARTRLGAYVALGELTGEQAEEAMALLKRDEARLIPRDRRYRHDLIRFSKGEASFLEVFGAGHTVRPEPAPKPAEDEVSPPITPPDAQGLNLPLTLYEPPTIDQPVTPPEPAVAEEPVLLSEPPVVYQPVAPAKPVEIGQTIVPDEPTDVDPPVPAEPSILDRPVTPSAPEVLPGTSGGGALPEAKKSILSFSSTKAFFIPAVFAIGVVLLGVYFFVAPDTRSVPSEPYAKIVPSEPNTKSISPEPSTKSVPLDPGAKSVPSEPSTKSVPLESGDKSVVAPNATPDHTAEVAKAKECSAKADAQGLHCTTSKGCKTREAFRAKCKSAVAMPGPPPAITPALQSMGPKTAGKPLQLASYGDWGVFLARGETFNTCYALATPKDRAPPGFKRDPAYVFIANRLGENVREEISIIMGFPVKEDGARAEVGGSGYDLIADGANAWIKEAAEETQFIDALKKGSKLIVKARSLKGNVTTDSYSLAGLSQALERVQKECP